MTAPELLLSKPPRGKAPASLANLSKGRSNSVNPRKRYSYANLAKMTRFMQRGKFSTNDLAKHAGCSWASANRWIKALHDERHKSIHVVDWVRSINNKVMYPIYAWGDLEDVPKPSRIPNAVHQRKNRAKKTLGSWVDLTVGVSNGT